MKKKTGQPPGRNGAKKNGMPRWKPRLDDYRLKEIALLTFSTDKDMHAAIDLVWVGRLQNIPFELAPDGDSLVVPKAGVPYFTKAGIRFVEKPARA